jgi:hypothetical protein
MPQKRKTNMPRGLVGVIYGKEGTGKTSLGLQFPGPVKCLSVGENGYDYLADVNAVPENSINIAINTFEQLVDESKKITAGTLLVDSLKGVQKLIFDYVQTKYYEGNFTKFNAFSEGPRKFSPPVLQNYLDLLSQKASLGVNIILLAHMGTASVPNTLGADYLSHVILLDDGDRGGMRSTVTSWAGFIFFLNNAISLTIRTETNKAGQITEGKAENVDQRWIFTTTSPVHQAKNRWNMPAQISMGKNPKEAFSNLWKYVPENYKSQKA